ncbi:MAG: prephenate dehydrogenase [Oscillospiraceae bacterium]|nr:prephenate dehydrogenase [Oscillospiraceae bacterium]
MSKTIAIVGLGLIGGSMALALQGFEEYSIVGVDVSQPTLRYATENHVADRVTDDAAKAVAEADVVFLCLHPQGIVNFLQEHKGHFKKGALVTDVCGIKTAVVEAARVLSSQVEFIGGHPMAGTEFSGVQNALKHMFRGAHYIITPDENSSPDKVALLERMAAYIGCSDVVKTTPEQHDAIIAYTSQMMHVIAVSVCDDPRLFDFMGFEGDSFRGCTRVAALDVPLWTQLFAMNAPALDQALEQLEKNINAYRQALRSGDREALAQKLEWSSARKRKMNRAEAEKNKK